MTNDWKKNYLRYKGYFLNILRIYYTKPNIKIYLELMLSLLTISVFAVFAIKPTALTIIELNKEIKSKEETISKIEQKLVNLQTADKILESEFQRLAYIENSVPDSAYPNALITEMERLSSKNSLEILNLTISDVTVVGKSDKKHTDENIDMLPQNAEELPFSVSLKGQYKDLVSFIVNAENLRRPVKFDSITINSTKTDEGKVIVLMITGRLPFTEKAVMEEIYEK